MFCPLLFADLITGMRHVHRMLSYPLSPETSLALRPLGQVHVTSLPVGVSGWVCLGSRVGIDAPRPSASELFRVSPYESAERGSTPAGRHTYVIGSSDAAAAAAAASKVAAAGEHVYWTKDATDDSQLVVHQTTSRRVALTRGFPETVPRIGQTSSYWRLPWNSAPSDGRERNRMAPSLQQSTASGSSGNRMNGMGGVTQAVQKLRSLWIVNYFQTVG